eukprot:g3980.t1
MIGSEPGLTDIVKDGRVNDEFTSDAKASVMNTLGREAFTSHFYIRKEGKPIVGNVTVHHAHALQHTEIRMKPVIKGDQFKEQERGDYVINETLSDLIIDYNCVPLETGATSYVWIDIFVDTNEADESCGVPAKHMPYHVNILWTKFCGGKLLDDRGVSLGTKFKVGDVVLNGKTQPEWMLPDSSAPTTAKAKPMTVYSAQSNSTFYIMTNDSSIQSFGTPRFENDDSKLIVMLGSAFDGGLVSPAPQKIVVHYLCDVTARAPVEITMVIDLCAREVPPADCDVDRNSGYDPIVVHWMKNCGVEDGSQGMNSRQIVAITLVCVAFSMCVVTSVYRYVKLQKRGAEIVPMGPEIESAFRACWDSLSGVHTVRYGRVGQQENDDSSSEGIAMSIGKKVKSSNGEVTVRFNGGTSSYGSSAYQSEEKADDPASTYGAANGSKTAGVGDDDQDSMLMDGGDSDFDNSDI